MKKIAFVFAAICIALAYFVIKSSSSSTPTQSSPTAVAPTPAPPVARPQKPAPVAEPVPPAVAAAAPPPTPAIAESTPPQPAAPPPARSLDELSETELNDAAARAAADVSRLELALRDAKANAANGVKGGADYQDLARLLAQQEAAKRDGSVEARIAASAKWLETKKKMDAIESAAAKNSPAVRQAEAALAAATNVSNVIAVKTDAIAAAKRAQEAQKLAQRENSTFTAEKLMGVYMTNEVTADAALKGKQVYVTGVIEKIGKDILDTPYVALKTRDDLRSVQCMFDAKNAAALYSLRPGQQITIRGTCTGLMMNVLLNKCSIE